METINISKTILIGMILFFTGIFLFHWLGCTLDNKFFFSPLDLNLRIIFDVRSDGNIPLQTARLLHNKITEGSTNIFAIYSNYWDIRFLLFFLSPVTFFGVIIWMFSSIKQKKLSIFEKCLVFIVLLIPLCSMFGIIKSQSVVLLLFSLPFLIFAGKGLLQFSKTQRYYWIYLLIVSLVSFFLLVSLQTNIVDMCHV